MNDSPKCVRAVNLAAGTSCGVIDVYAGPAHNVGLTTTVQRGSMPRVAQIESLPLGDVLQPDESQRVRLIKIDVEGGEDSVLAGLLPTIDRLPTYVEIAVELSPLWWADRSRSGRDVLGPFVRAGFNVYTIDNNYWPWRYLWPNDVRRPRRLRDESMLARPMKRLDVVLSRVDADEL